MAARMTDAEMLEIMDMKERLGLTGIEIARRTGKTRSAILGLTSRINGETDQHDLSPHLNGTMPARWWEAGLRARPDA